MNRSSSLYWLYANIKTFSNFPQIYISKALGTLPKYLRTWNGAKFSVLNLNSNVGTVIEVWHDKAYGDLGEIFTIPNPVVIDIGANIGAFTIYACKKFSNPRVYAFEPEKNNFNLLANNIVLNEFVDQAVAVEKAVCGTAGNRTLNVAGESSGNNSFDMDQPYTGSQKVACTTLADIFKENRIDFCHLLKIDCEGSEYEVLLGADSSLFEKIGTIVVEVHPVTGYSMDDIKGVLTRHGYSIRLSESNGAVIIAQRKISVGDGL